MTRIRTLALVLVPALLASGCGLFKTEEQLRAERAREKPLEVPPDLTSPAADQRYALPDPKSSTSYSQYSRDRTGRAAGHAGRQRHAGRPAAGPERAHRAQRRPALDRREGGARAGMADRARVLAGPRFLDRPRDPAGGNPRNQLVRVARRRRSVGHPRLAQPRLRRHVLHGRARPLSHAPRAGAGAGHDGNLREPSRAGGGVPHRPRRDEVAAARHGHRPRPRGGNARPPAREAGRAGQEGRPGAGWPAGRRRVRDRFRHSRRRQRRAPEQRRRPAGSERRLRPRLAPRRACAGQDRLHGRGPRPFEGPLLRALHRSGVLAPTPPTRASSTSSPSGAPRRKPRSRSSASS